MMIGTNLALDSWWGLVSAVPITAILVVRILDEEKALVTELDGYRRLPAQDPLPAGAIPLVATVGLMWCLDPVNSPELIAQLRPHARMSSTSRGSARAGARWSSSAIGNCRGVPGLRAARISRRSGGCFRIKHFRVPRLKGSGVMVAR